MSTFGYARISRKEQNIDRQIKNIKDECPDAIILQEAFTGTRTEGRKEFAKLMKAVKSGDTVIFDSVSRMSRNSKEGIELYMKWFDMGVNMIFLKERYINSSVYASRLQQAEISTGKDFLDEGLRIILMGLAKEQIQIAFDQSEKEVADLHVRTAEGIREIKAKNEKILAGIETGEVKQIGQKPGAKLTTKKSLAAKQTIKKHSIAFDGTLNDKDCQKLAGISRNSFYKYKRELAKEING